MRQALELALEALEDRTSLMKWQIARDAVKEALAQPEQEPVAWKLMPRYATDAMLKAMDECSTEGYDERLYAGHAASVYMAAWDEAPTPPQRKPLTDEQIDGIASKFYPRSYGLDEFARAIEAAHGIKE